VRGSLVFGASILLFNYCVTQSVPDSLKVWFITCLGYLFCQSESILSIPVIVVFLMDFINRIRRGDHTPTLPGRFFIIRDDAIDGNVNLHAYVYNATPLHDAIINGNYKLCYALVENDACNVNARDAEGRTPLHLAVRSGDIKLCRLLIEKVYHSLLALLFFSPSILSFHSILN